MDTLEFVDKMFIESPTDPTRLIHPKLEELRKQRKVFREQCSAAGKKGSASRAKKAASIP